MTPEHWRQVTELFHAALARDASARASYLEEVCAGDRALRADVDALLAAHAKGPQFGERPVNVSVHTVQLVSGTLIGPYRIDQLIGAGGMGRVYRARDTKLGRDVAIKVLPASVALEPERVRRFEREARLLAALNHPHIAAIYSVEESPATDAGHSTVHALVLELVEGPTLAERLTQGPLPIAEALHIARQIAEALEAAHENRIIHRDLKPANIKLTADGTVKVLDFGLAKALAGEGSDSDLSRVSMVTLDETREGMIAGTVAYMSPEQAQGKPVDKRTDIWAFGCVLYEVLAGTPAFRGETVSETLAEVMKSEPSWAALPPETPATLRNVVRRCLAKDPRQRVRDIGDVRLALEGAFETAAATVVAVPRLRVWQRPLPLVAAIVTLAFAMGLASWTLTRSAPLRVVRFTMTPSGAVPLGIDNVAISPDGTRLAYVVAGRAGQIVVRAFDQLEPTAVLSVGGATTVTSVFFSPDGQWIGFEDGPIGLKKVAVTGGPPTTVLRTNESLRGASWNTDDTIIFAINVAYLPLSYFFGSRDRRSEANQLVFVFNFADSRQGQAYAETRESR